jgi:putative transposase
MLKKHPHTPAHLFLDDTPYFITGAIYEKRHLLESTELKQLLLKQINEYFKQYDWELHHWVILDNHFHLMGKSKLGKDMTRIMQGIHGSTSKPIQETTGGVKPIWWNYWDYCLRNDRDYVVRLNYLLWNPAKHGYVEKLEDYLFSSYHQLLAAEGAVAMNERFQRYPEYQKVVLHEAKDDDF